MRAIVILVAATGTLQAQEVDYDKPLWGIQVVDVNDAQDILKADPKIPAVPVRRGMMVVKKTAGTPASDKFQVLDVITLVDRKPTGDHDTFLETLSESEAGGERSFTVFRAVELKTGAYTWKKGTVTAAPVDRREFIRSLVTKETDEFRSVDRFLHKDAAKVRTRTHVALLFTKESDDEKPGPMLLRFHLRNEDWLFVKKIEIMMDGKPIEVPISGRNALARDNSASWTWEWISVPVDEKLQPVLEHLVATKPATVRFSGDFHLDYEVSEDDRKAIAETWHAREVMSGK